jgi:hypothetical protein
MGMEAKWRTRDGESGFWLKDGTFDTRDYGPREPDDLEPSEMADMIYTSEWSRIETEAQAEDFLIPLWKRLSLNEKRFVYELYHGRDTTAAEIAMLEDMVVDIDAQIAARIADLDSERESEVAEYKEALGDTDIDETPFQTLDARIRELEDTKAMVQSCAAAVRSRASVVGVSGLGIQAGGARKGDKMYLLMALADSLHDFAKSGKIDLKKIQDAIGAEIPYNLTDAANKDKRYKNQHYPALEMIADEEAFIKFMDANEEMQFSTGPEKHNMYKRDMLGKFKLKKALDKFKGNKFIAFVKQRNDNRASKAEIWAATQVKDSHGTVDGEDPTDKHKDVIFMAQIMSVVDNIKRNFGKGKLTFIMDKTDCQMSRMIIATSVIDDGISKTFTVKDDSGFELPVDHVAKPRKDWSFKVCDANIIDGNYHFREPPSSTYLPHPQISEHRTGVVFRQCLTKVELKGIETRLKDPNYPRTKVSVLDRADVTIKHSDPNDRYGNKFTKSAMGGNMVARTPLLGYVEEEFLACKRACDWGQVMHCKRHSTPDDKYIFVAYDRPACMYAMFENVGAMFCSRTNMNMTGWPENPQMFQTTFTMLAPLAVSHEQSGGGSSKVVIGACLLAVTLAMALLS